MNKKMYFVLLSILVIFLLVSCGSNEENSSSISQNKIDKGQLTTYVSEAIDDTNISKSLFEIKAITSTDTKDLTDLKICSKTNCWIVSDNTNLSRSLKASTRSLSEQTQVVDTVVNIGSFDVSDINETIESIQYKYDGKEGVLDLENKINFAIAQDKELYLQLDDTVKVPFSSLSIEDGKNGLFIPNIDFKKEFINGVIIEVPKGSSNEMANIYINRIGEIVDENLVTNAYSIMFYKVSTETIDFDNVINEFQKVFNKEILVYIPVDLINDDLNYINENYTLSINNLDINFNILNINSQNYILFKTNNTSIKAILYSNDMEL